MEGSRARAEAHLFGNCSQLHGSQSLRSPAITRASRDTENSGQWKPPVTGQVMEAVVPGTIHLPEKAGLPLDFL